MGHCTSGGRALQVVFLAGVLLAGMAWPAAAYGSLSGRVEPWQRAEHSIVYGTDDTSRQVLNAYLPAVREAARPAVLYFHGGSFVAGSPNDASDAARFLTQRGYVAILVGYRLHDPDAGTDRWPAQLDDAQRAVRWVRANATVFGVDPDRVCAVGHSSGGQLAGLLGTTESMDAATDDLAGYSSRVDCVVMIAGDADLTVPYETPAYAHLIETLLGGSLDDRPEAYAAASPAHHVDEHSAPFLVLHGSDDALVPHQQTSNLLGAFAAVGRDVDHVRLPYDHISILRARSTWQHIERFLAEQVHPER